jgi:hypothetical protein
MPLYTTLMLARPGAVYPCLDFPTRQTEPERLRFGRQFVNLIVGILPSDGHISGSLNACTKELQHTHLVWLPRATRPASFVNTIDVYAKVLPTVELLVVRTYLAEETTHICHKLLPGHY